jgi:hypothetical protein
MRASFQRKLEYFSQLVQAQREEAESQPDGTGIFAKIYNGFKSANTPSHTHA